MAHRRRRHGRQDAARLTHPSPLPQPLFHPPSGAVRRPPAAGALHLVRQGAKHLLRFGKMERLCLQGAVAAHLESSPRMKRQKRNERISPRGKRLDWSSVCKGTFCCDSYDTFGAVAHFTTQNDLVSLAILLIVRGFILVKFQGRYWTSGKCNSFA